MNNKNLAELRQMSVQQLTGIYIDQLFGGNKVLAFNGDAVNFSSNNNNVINFADMKITDSNCDQVLSEAEASARAYAESRNRNAQPKNLTGLDQDLVKATRDWANKRSAHLRCKK